MTHRTSKRNTKPSREERELQRQLAAAEADLVIAKGLIVCGVNDLDLQKRVNEELTKENRLIRESNKTLADELRGAKAHPNYQSPLLSMEAQQQKVALERRVEAAERSVKELVLEGARRTKMLDTTLEMLGSMGVVVSKLAVLGDSSPVAGS